MSVTINDCKETGRDFALCGDIKGVPPKFSKEEIIKNDNINKSI